MRRDGALDRRQPGHPLARRRQRAGEIAERIRQPPGAVRADPAGAAELAVRRGARRSSRRWGRTSTASWTRGRARS
ncbi:MAG: hypothetical protein MZV70_37670 [Desulfobacterales bacterium]|nr:hypothetical protein [Desulfobacterales bacterium]